MSKMTIEFEEQVWAQIIDMLLDQPGKKCLAIVNTMAQQIQEQRPPADTLPQAPRGNGRAAGPEAKVDA